MSPRRIAASRARLVRAILALTGVSACLGAAAYAANRSDGREAGLGESKPVGVAPQQGADAPKAEQRLPRAAFIERPDSTSTAAEPQFRFHVPPRSQEVRRLPAAGPAGEPAPPRRFQCRLDGEDWEACSSPLRLRDLAPGDHRFAIRAFDRSGRPGPAASYSWQQVEAIAEQRQVEPQPFSIELRSELEALLPGDPAQPLALTIDNPNTVAIEVTSLTASIFGAPNCPAENFELTPSSASTASPLNVPAAGAVDLPTAAVTAPAIAMLNLPLNQDACRGASLHLDFRGEARG